MSWFIFGKEFSSLWESYGTINSLVTGQFVGEYIFEKKLSPLSSYKKIKETIAINFSKRTQERFKPTSRKIAHKILKKHVATTTFSAAWQNLANKVNQLPRCYFIDDIKYRIGLMESPVHSHLTSCPLNPADLSATNRISKTSHKRIVRLRNYFKNQQDQGDFGELKPLLKESHIKNFAHLQPYLNFKSICQPAILEAVGSASKLGADLAVDFASKKIIIMASLPVLSWLFSTAASWTHYLLQDQIDHCFLAPCGSHVISYLPSTTTILTVSSIYHLAEIAYKWQVTYRSDTNLHEDKKQIHRLAMKYLEAPLAKKIQHSLITKKLGLNLTEEAVNKIAAQLINKAINHYWKTLSETFILGMPLVS